MKKAVSAIISSIIALSASAMSYSAEKVCSASQDISSEIDGVLYTIICPDPSKSEAKLVSVSNTGEDLTIPSQINELKITSIGAKAFFGNTDLISVQLPETVKNIGVNAFTGCLNLESAIIPDSVSELGEGCFMSCTALENVIFGHGIKAIPENCFYSCTALSNIEFPANVTEIGNQAFFGCSDLSGTYIPSTVTLIGKDAIGRHYSIRDGRTETISGFKLFFKNGSAADEFAKQHGIENSLLMGDADLDNKITANDASLVLAEYAMISGGNHLSFNEKQIIAADINSDGKIDARDSALILKKYAEIQKAQHNAQ